MAGFCVFTGVRTQSQSAQPWPKLTLEPPAYATMQLMLIYNIAKPAIYIMRNT